MGQVVPTSFTAGRAINLAGTDYAAGAVIPVAVVAQLHNASALLSRRWIIPNVDEANRRGIRPRPVAMGAKLRRALLGP